MAPSHAPLLEPWKLRLAKEADWGKCYTGFDPVLQLPDGLDEATSMRHLKAFACFADRVPPDLISFSVQLNKADEAVGTRFSFNTHIPDLARRAHNLLDYMRKSGGYSNKQMAGWGIQCHPTYAYASFAAVVDVFARECEKNPAISARGFLEHFGTTVKIQYVEPELLYIGQTLKETAATIKKCDFPESQQTMIADMQRDYAASGLADSVAELRALANTQLAKSQTRRSYNQTWSSGL